MIRYDRQSATEHAVAASAFDTCLRHNTGTHHDTMWQRCRRSVGRFDELLVGRSAVWRWRRRRMIIVHDRRGPAATIIILRHKRHTEDNARAHTHTLCTEYTYTGAHTHTLVTHTRTVRWSGGASYQWRPRSARSCENRRRRSSRSWIIAQRARVDVWCGPRIGISVRRR